MNFIHYIPDGNGTRLVISVPGAYLVPYFEKLCTKYLSLVKKWIWVVLVIFCDFVLFGFLGDY